MPLNARRRGPLRALLVLCAALLLLFPLPAHADGDPSQDVIRSLTVDYELDVDGTLHVTETYEWDFGTRNGLGFYRSLIQRMGYDSTQQRVYEYSGFDVTSPSGAPADVWISDETTTEIVLSIGAPDGSSDTRTGVQTYVLTYEARGTLNAIRGEPGVDDQDEFYFNVFDEADNRMDQATVRVTGPAGVVDHACYHGPDGATDGCTTEDAAGPTATFTQSDIPARDALTVMAAFPAGTFTNTDPILEPIPEDPVRDAIDGSAFGRASQFIGSNWPALAAGWTALLGAVAGVRIWRGRDRAYVGLAPGQMPVPGQQVEEARMGAEPPVAVRFTPPDGLTPGEAEVIEDEMVTTEAFTATLVDLAVRGYLIITPTDMDSSGNPRDWVLDVPEQKPDVGELLDHERQMLQMLFAGAPQVSLKKLQGKFTARMKHFNKLLTAHSDSRGWFRSRGLLRTHGAWGVLFRVFRLLYWIFPVTIMAWAYTMGRVAGLLPLIIGFVLVVTTPILVFALTRKAAHARTAKGRALYEQVRSFREYLSTAEAHQIRWEAGEDIYSRYLPWAIIFGVSDRWTEIFEQLRAEGRYTARQTWYRGSGGPSVNIRTVGSGVKRLGRSGVYSLRYSAGSSGGSGSRRSRGGGGRSRGGGGGGRIGGR
ncbi:MAG: DUF2207 domain-containing protein [bacterium]|nr:DUF2207 domain-containing protein [bacterium]